MYRVVETSTFAEHLFSDLSPGILISKLDTCSFTSLRVGVILTRTTLYSGPTEVFTIQYSHRLYFNLVLGPGCSSSLGAFMELGKSFPTFKVPVN